jgi:hypothetical protein
MDILTGDPFYHNIIYHLSRSSLHVLKCTCKYFNTNINNTLINKVTINNIKNQLHKTFGENIKKIEQFKETFLQKGKYFVVTIKVDCKHIDLEGNFIIEDYEDNNLGVKVAVFGIKINTFLIRTSSNASILIVESLDENSIHIPEIKKMAWGSHNEWFDVFWIETDNSEEFNLLEHL